MTLPDHLVALAAFGTLLHEQGIAYHVGGSVASSVWGRGRSTADVDLVATVTDEVVDALVDGAQATFYVDATMIREAIRRGRSFNVVHLEAMIKIDVFIRGPGPYDDAAAARVRRVPLTDEPGYPSYPVAAPEDVVLRKLAWYRSGGETSKQQWSDLIGVLRVQRDQLDRDWMRRWAPALGVADLLDPAFAEAEALG